MKQTFARFIITLYVYKTQQIKHPSQSLVFSLLMGVGLTHLLIKYINLLNEIRMYPLNTIQPT